ncbi:MAG: hypothetical protein BV458_10680 [Thermoplasmata archaeon M9B2D]|nr:MAG: hypothetical protein BV458_10680 [Thermoplasmata archaeon M9B2D]
MIIELTGVPGAGKSTVLEKLKKSKETQGTIFDIQKYVLERSILPLKGKAAYELALLSHIFLLTSADRRLLKNVFSLVRNSSNSLFHKANILRNTLKKLIIYRYIADREERFLIDEGVSHIPFTVFVDIGRTISGEKVEAFMRELPPVDLLLVVDAPDDVLLDRVIARGSKGHRRINFDSHEDVVAFMQQSRKVVEYVKRHFGGHVYTNTVEDIDTGAIIKLLGSKDV